MRNRVPSLNIKKRYFFRKSVKNSQSLFFLGGGEFQPVNLFREDIIDLGSKYLGGARNFPIFFAKKAIPVIALAPPSPSTIFYRIFSYFYRGSENVCKSPHRQFF